MPSTLTDADIDRHDAGGGAPATLSDADIDAHDRGETQPFKPFQLGAPGSDIAHPQFGPSPEAARVGNEVFRNIGSALQHLPSGVMAFVRHPVDTISNYVGQTNENPEKSSGLLGMVDVLGRKVQAGQTPEAIGDILTMALPGALKEGGLEAAGEAVNRAAGTAGTAIRGGVRGGVEGVPNAILTSAARFTGIPQVAQKIAQGARQELAKRAAAQTAASPGIRRLVMAAQQAPAPESVLPESVAADLTRPSTVTPPPEAAAQLNAQAAPAPAPVPIATRMANAARVTRASTADTLAQTLEDEGLANTGQTMPVFKLGDFARLHKIDWPVDQSARLSLMEATRAALRQRTTK